MNTDLSEILKEKDLPYVTELVEFLEGKGLLCQALYPHHGSGEEYLNVEILATGSISHIHRVEQLLESSHKKLPRESFKNEWKDTSQVGVEQIALEGLAYYSKATPPNLTSRFLIEGGKISSGKTVIDLNLRVLEILADVWVVIPKGEHSAEAFTSLEAAEKWLRKDPSFGDLKIMTDTPLLKTYTALPSGGILDPTILVYMIKCPLDPIPQGKKSKPE